MVATPKRANRRQRRAEQGKGPQVGLSAEQAASRKQRLRGIDLATGDELPGHIPPEDARGNPRTFAASEPWIDAAYPTRVEETPDGPLTTYYYAPNATPAGFVRCRKCGHQSPRICVSAKGFCMDCRFYELDKGRGILQGSTSSLSMKRVKRARKDGSEITPGGL